LVRATAKDERKAVETVLTEFFTLTDAGWTHARCEAEISKAAGIAERARENGKLGGNPYKKQQYNEPGFLYALDIGGAIKVGITKNPQQRLYEHRRKFKGCQYFLVVSVPDMGKCEDDTLRAFASVAVGERLNLAPDRWHELAAHMESLGTPAGSPNKGGGLPPNPNPITNYSEPNGSGGKPPMSPDEIIFGYGVPLLVNAGSTDKAARSFLGGLRKGHGGDAVVDALRNCLREKPLQPLEWLAAALPPHGAKSTKPNAQEALEAANRAVGERFLAEQEAARASH
jgi:hypothetical protein